MPKKGEPLKEPIKGTRVSRGIVGGSEDLVSGSIVPRPFKQQPSQSQNHGTSTSEPTPATLQE